jgi:hypothetical protein
MQSGVDTAVIALWLGAHRHLLHQRLSPRRHDHQAAGTRTHPPHPATGVARARPIAPTHAGLPVSCHTWSSTATKAIWCPNAEGGGANP